MFICKMRIIKNLKIQSDEDGHVTTYAYVEKFVHFEWDI